MTKEIKLEEVKQKDFIKLSDLTAKDVEKWSRVPIKLSRRTTRNGIHANMQVIINPINLVIPVVSTELINGQTRRLQFYKADRMVALLFDLNVPQVDSRGLGITEWTFNAPIRFVKGLMNSGDTYYQLEILFKQYKYESVFLNADQVSILESLDKRGQLLDSKGNKYSLIWEVRSDNIDDLGEDIFEF